MATIPDHPYRILIIEGSGSGKTNSIIYLISHQQNINKIYLTLKIYMNKRESTGLKHLNDSKVFSEYSNDMN